MVNAARGEPQKNGETSPFAIAGMAHIGLCRGDRGRVILKMSGEN